MAVNLNEVNYILLDDDGSIIAQSMDYYVQQGSTGVDKIFFSTNDLQVTDTCIAVCTLPNGQQNTLAGVLTEGTYQEQTSYGFMFTLTTAQTNYNGSLMMSIALYRGSKRIVCYPLCVVINETGLRSDTDTGVTIEEINSYLQVVQSKLDISNGILVVDTMSESIAEEREIGQIFFSRFTGEFYIKTSDSSPYYETYHALRFVPKTDEAYKVYATGTTGGQVTLKWSLTNEAYSVARRKADGNLSVNQTPNANDDATSKKYVDDKVADMMQKSFQSVNTTIYPTLASFLLSTGQEGYVYLYPINTADLSQGQYQYIWENNAWVLIGTTNIDMSDYVKKTSSAKQLYGTDGTGAQTTYTLTSMIMADMPAQRDSSGNIATPNSPTSNSSAINVNYANAHYVAYSSGYVSLDGLALEFGVSEIYEDDGALKIDSIDTIQLNADTVELNGSTVTINSRDVLKELDQLKAEFYEAVVDIKDYSFAEQYLYALPTTISSQPLLYSAGMDVMAIKGRTLAVNQLNEMYNFPSNSDYNTNNVTLTIADNVASIVGTNGGSDSIYRFGKTKVTGHKYLVMYTAKASANISAGFGVGGVHQTSQFSVTPSWQTFFGIVTAVSDNNVDYIYTSENTETLEAKDFYIVDLTQMFNGNSNIPADLLSHPENFFQYFNGDLSYNEGKLVHSVPTKFIARGLNQWDEETEGGIYNTSDGTKVAHQDYIRSKNKFRVKPNTTYKYTVGYTQGVDSYIVALFYDAQDNYIGNFAVNENATFTTPQNAYYMAFYINDQYGSSYRNDICINISNASLNGTYKPFTKDERSFQYPPTLKGIDSTCYDDTALKKTKVYEFTGEEVWQYYSQENAFVCRSACTDISDAKTSSAKTMTSNGIVCEIVVVGVQKAIVVNVADNPQLTSSSDLNEIFAEGSELLYELATPVAQAGHTSLPEDIKIEEGGTLECVYQEDGETPLLSIDTQVATIK